jgi:hypothetical protein
MILITNAGITTILILSLFLGKDAVMKLFAWINVLMEFVRES